MSEKVFISYSSRDEIEVKKVTDLLDKEGISYWKAPEMIPAGSNYAREIPKAIRECKIFLLLISATSQESIWVEKEIDCAVNNRKIIVPLKLTKAPLSDMFRFYLNNVQTIFYDERQSEALDQLKERLHHLLMDTKEGGMDAHTTLNDEKVNENLEISQNVNTRKKKQRIGFSMNPEPVSCSYCGGEVVQISRGVFQCVQCKKENYDAFRTVRNYLEKAGPCTVDVIVKETGIPRKSVDYFFKEELLEIPKSSPLRVSCKECGAPIRSGVLCDNCKAKKVGLPIQNHGRFHSKKYRFDKKD